MLIRNRASPLMPTYRLFFNDCLPHSLCKRAPPPSPSPSPFSFDPTRSFHICCWCVQEHQEQSKRSAVPNPPYSAHMFVRQARAECWVSFEGPVPPGLLRRSSGRLPPFFGALLRRGATLDSSSLLLEPKL